MFYSIFWPINVRHWAFNFSQCHMISPGELQAARWSALLPGFNLYQPAKAPGCSILESWVFVARLHNVMWPLGIFRKMCLCRSPKIPPHESIKTFLLQIGILYIVTQCLYCLSHSNELIGCIIARHYPAAIPRSVKRNCRQSQSWVQLFFVFLLVWKYHPLLIKLRLRQQLPWFFRAAGSRQSSPLHLPPLYL